VSSQLRIGGTAEFGTGSNFDPHVPIGRQIGSKLVPVPGIPGGLAVQL
jgi:hypothetical protein